MANLALRRLSKVQKKLYDSMVPQAKNLASGINRDVYLYSKKFEASLPKIIKLTTLQTMKKSVQLARFILFGDFHTHKQSQKEFRRVIERICKDRSQKPILALECFRRVDQRWIDRYMSDEINDSVLLNKTKYYEHWGFPPENYLPLLDFAKEFDLKVFGINSRGAGRDPLEKRDEFMARCLSTISKKHPKSKIFCLAGEFHLATTSLPKNLKSLGEDSIVRIVMNVDQYYFSQKQGTLPNETHYYRLSQDSFCIMNSAPWLKWQSFTLWQETKQFGLRNNREKNRENDDFAHELEHELEYDIDSHFYTLSKIMDEYLDLQIKEHQITDFHIYCGIDGLLEYPRLQEILSEQDLGPIKSKLQFCHYVWLDQVKALLLAKIDTNTLSEAAGRHIYSIMNRKVPSNQASDLFYERILETSFAVICSKIINPQRKYPDMHQITQNIMEGVPAWKENIDVIDRLAKKHLDWLFQKTSSKKFSYKRPLISLYRKDAELYGKISYRIGQYWGSYLYSCLIQEALSLENLKSIFQASLAPKDKYLQIVGFFYSDHMIKMDHPAKHA